MKNWVQRTCPHDPTTLVHALTNENEATHVICSWPADHVTFTWILLGFCSLLFFFSFLENNLILEIFLKENNLSSIHFFTINILSLVDKARFSKAVYPLSKRFIYSLDTPLTNLFYQSVRSTFYGLLNKFIQLYGNLK